MDKERILDHLILFGIVIVLLSGIFLVAYFLHSRTNECIASPFVFGAKQMEEQYDLEMYGQIRFVTVANQQSPIFFFNSTDLWLE